MKHLYLFIYGVLLLLVPCPGQSQGLKVNKKDIQVSQIPFAEGVNCLLKDFQGFLWTGTDQGLFRYDGFDFEQFGDQRSIVFRLENNQILGLFEDGACNLWIGAGHSIHVLSADRTKLWTRKLAPEYFDDKQVLPNTPFSFVEFGSQVWAQNQTNTVWIFEKPEKSLDTILLKDTVSVSGVWTRLLHWNGMIAIAQSGQDIRLYDQDVELLDRYPLIKFKDFVELDSNSLIMGTRDALFRFKGNLAEPMRIFKEPDSLLTQAGYRMEYDRSGKRIWLGVNDFLRYFDESSGQLVDIGNALSDSGFFDEFQLIQTMLVDGDVLWIGTSTGLYQLKRRNSLGFEIFEQPSIAGSNRFFSTRGIFELPDGDILVGSYKGLTRYNGNLEYLNHYSLVEGNTEKNPLAYRFIMDNGRLWMATEGTGLLEFTDLRRRSGQEGNSVVSWNIQRNEQESTSSWLFAVEKNYDGSIWLGSIGGLYLLGKDGKPERLRLRNDESILEAKIYALEQGPDSTMWIGTSGGLYSLAPGEDSLHFHTLDPERLFVNCIYPSKDGNIYIGTRGFGMFIFHPARGIMEQYGTKEGLPDLNINSLEPDRDSVLWMGTNQGLARFDLATGYFYSYFANDGLPDNEFNHGASGRDALGRLYFGTVNGVTRFDPQVVMQDANPDVPITLSKIGYHDGKEGKTKYHIFDIDSIGKIHLSHHDKYFNFSFSKRNLSSRNEEYYLYMLEGLHDDWQKLGSRNYVEVTGMKPGRYILKVKEEHPLDERSPRILSFPVWVDQAFYKTWWAYLVYLITGSGLIVFVIRNFYRRKLLRNKLQLELERSVLLEEINRSKSTFFSNITHEFKTPLTLIKGPAEEIYKKSDEPGIRKKAKLISRNAESILSLVNQLIDLNKLEADFDKPRYYRLDICSHIQNWLKEFQPLAEKKQISLEHKLPGQPIYVDFDPVKLQKLFNNLVSNAIKFTPDHGHVTCILDPFGHDPALGEACVSITIRDSGPGIRIDEAEQVFDRFFKGEHSSVTGSGIGLSFVREIARLHRGRVELEAGDQNGASFRVTLPVLQDDVRTETGELEAGVSLLFREDAMVLTSGLKGGEKPVILIAEDHSDVAQLVADVLGSQFEIHIRPDGQAAFAEAVRRIPDLVITDVMMPFIDGYTLTHMLKNDQYTSHIPVIMLTAKDRVEDRISGRGHGADIYLNKPFSSAELQYAVRNLLQLKERLLATRQNEVVSDLKGVELDNDRDKSFYMEFLACVEERLGDSSLTVSEVGDSLHISRTQLHRKLKAITGQSAIELIRALRMQKAMSLLQHSGKQINEIGYEVGFSTPSYFSETFREFHGMTPSEARSGMPGSSK